MNRHRADAQVNASLVEVLNKEKCEFEKKPQGELRVGDIVKVSDGDIFPADLIFLRSGEEKAPKTCWINTKSLDGETDNKLRQAMKVGNGMMNMKDNKCSVLPNTKDVLYLRQLRSWLH